MSTTRTCFQVGNLRFCHFYLLFCFFAGQIRLIVDLLGREGYVFEIWESGIWALDVRDEGGRGGISTCV